MLERIANAGASLRNLIKGLPWWGWVVGGAVLGIVALVWVWFGYRPGHQACRGPAEQESGLVSTAVDDKQAAELAQRYAPIFVFTNKEGFHPIPRERYTQLSSLYEFRTTKNKTLVAGFDGKFAYLPGIGCEPGCHYFLRVNGLRPKAVGPFRKLERRKLATVRPTIYYHAVAYAEPGQAQAKEYDVEYWLFYLYNSLKGDHHESDLEQVTMRIPAGADKPTQAFYSTHVGGVVRNWDDVESQDGQAVAYVAVSSHANYFATGIHPTLAQCQKKNLREGKTCLVLKGIAARDWTDGCQDYWAWRDDASVAEPLSRDSCRDHHQRLGTLLRYELAPWTAHYKGSWGPARIRLVLDKRGVPKKTVDWFDDPSIRKQLWSDPLAEMQQKACYEGSAAG